jgi:putative nucleotidyltransferase with HDIG domain
MLDKEKLQEVEVGFLKEGMILSGILYDEKGIMLWPAKKPLTTNFIFKLKINDIKKVYYVPPKYKDTFANNPVISPQTQEYAVQAIEEIAHQINYGKFPDFNTARATIERFFEDIKSRPTGFLNLMTLKNYDSYTYNHSINVGILAMFLTKKLGFNDFFIQETGLGGFLHDIGKLKISQKIVNKNGILTEEEFNIMKEHPIFGFNLIRDEKSFSNYVKKMVLLHHERWDGSGYPMKLKAESIGNFSAIVAVCDVYDALTTERPYKNSYTVNDALIYIMRNTLYHFNPYVSQRFINEIAKMYDLGSFYPAGAFVQLNTGEIGLIKRKDSEYELRPEVLIIKNFQGAPLRNPILTDLQRDSSRTICKTIDDPREIENLSLLLAA